MCYFVSEVDVKTYLSVSVYYRSKGKGFMETCASVMTSLVLKIKANCVEVRISCKYNTEKHSMKICMFRQTTRHC